MGAARDTGDGCFCHQRHLPRMIVPGFADHDPGPGIEGWAQEPCGGILEVLLGFWASQQYLPVRGALLLIWVGFFALFRGISEIVIAFELRRAQHP